MKSLRRGLHRPGTIYIAVLGASLLITLIGFSAITAARITRREGAMLEDVLQAQAIAVAGVELGCSWTNANQGFRSSYLSLRSASGIWNTAGTSMSVGTVAVALSDPADNSLTNRPHDPVTIVSTGRLGSAVQMVQAQLTATGIALPILSNAITTPGTLDVNGELEVRDGAAVAGSRSGVVDGTTATFATSTAMPPATVVGSYAALGIAISPGSLINRAVLAPGFSTYGPAATDGVYVVTTSSDLTIRDMRLLGTLVIRAPGRRVIIDGQVFMEAARPDFPVLIVECGTLELRYQSAIFGNIVALSEFIEDTNFNPPGAPWVNTTNSSKFDVYPSEIRGTIYVAGKLLVPNRPLIKGTVIVTSTAVDAVRIDGQMRIEHRDAEVDTPSQWFTSRVDMSVTPGSWRQRIN